MIRDPIRFAVLGAVVVLTLAAVPTSANNIAPATPLAFAAAVTQAPTLAMGFAHAQPPMGIPIATSDNLPGPLAGFPTEGSTFGIISSGNALAADDPNSVGWFSASNGGSAHHGALDRDVMSVQLDLVGTPGFNCVSFDFRFLTEEYPEWVGSRYNDTFLAMVNSDNWWTTTSSAIVAPDNFARDEYGNTISVNTAGAATVAAWKAAGTTYDGATSLLRAQKIAHDADGIVSLYLTVFDVGDAIYDTSVFIDRVKIAQYQWWQCTTGMKGWDFGLDPNLDGIVVTPADPIYLEADATSEEVGGASTTVDVYFIVAEETPETSMETCLAWSETTTLDGNGGLSLALPPPVSMACSGLPAGQPGKYLVSLKAQTGGDDDEGTLYGEGLGGFVVE